VLPSHKLSASSKKRATARDKGRGKQIHITSF
jgi:hypothetical protein